MQVSTYKLDLPVQTNGATSFYQDLRIMIAEKNDDFESHRSVDETHRYWEKPDDGNNNPSWYAESPAGLARTDNLIKIISSLEIMNPAILEVGCNAGRNLNGLFSAGFKDINAVEISEDAIGQLSKSYPDLYSSANIVIGSAPSVLNNFDDGQFDVVFTMAVLQHIHSDDVDEVLDQIIRISGKVVLLHEVEDYASWRHFPRNYKKLMIQRGMNYHGRFKGLRVFSK